jgi:ubiquitin carboxyl-terminal hydrolase 1
MVRYAPPITPHAHCPNPHDLLLIPPDLNTPSSHCRSIRPVDVIAALSQPEPGRRASPLFSSREHQDAQELFQLVSEYVKKEATTVDREGARDLGFGAFACLSSAPAIATSVDVSKGVFDGLTANRRSCCECGYTEAVMHFPFDSWQLTVPRVVRSSPLPLTVLLKLSNSDPGEL